MLRTKIPFQLTYAGDQPSDAVQSLSPEMMAKKIVVKIQESDTKHQGCEPEPGRCSGDADPSLPPIKVGNGDERGEELLQEEGVLESQNRSTHLEVLFLPDAGLILSLEKGSNSGRHSEPVMQEA